MKAISMVLCALSILALPVVYAEQEPVLYKYKDETGTEIISSSLPGEAANRGYSVITPRGNVIERIPPKLTQEEIKEIEKQKHLEALKKQQEQEALEKKRIEAKRDEMLLKMFSNVHDIQRSKNDKITSIQVQQEITRENITRLREQLNKAQNAAQIHQEKKQAVPEQVMTTIEDTQSQLRENKAFLQRKTDEIKELKAKYNELIERFEHLQQKTKNHAPPSSSHIKEQVE